MVFPKVSIFVEIQKDVEELENLCEGRGVWGSGGVYFTSSPRGNQVDGSPHDAYS